MNDNNYYSNYNEDMEIDLLDMMFYIMQKWRGLLLALVIGVVMGSGLYIVKNHQQQAEQEAKEAELLKADESEEFNEKDYKISKDTKVNMDIAYQYRQLYNKQLEYNQKSIIMQLDPNAVYAGELKYYISAGNNTGLLSVLYQNILNDEEALEELKEASGFKCDTQYIKELLSSWTADENEASINITSSQDTDSVTAVAKHSFVTYKVISTSQKSCEKMLQVIRTQADELQSECEETYGSYSIIEVGNDISQVTDNTYLNMQRTNVDRLNDYLNTMKNAESNFTDKEKTYYNKKYLAKEYADKYQTSIPVVVAGGIMNENQVRHVLELGADGIQVATPFVTTEECDAADAFKQAYVDARPEDIEIVTSPVGMPARAIHNPFLEKISHGKECITKCYRCLEKCNPKEAPYCITQALIRAVKGDVNDGLIFCGDNAAYLDHIGTVPEVIKMLFGSAE